MHKTVGELETTMSLRELGDWWRFEAANRQLLPDQLMRLIDIHFATVLSTMVNMVGSSDSGIAKPSDFFVLRDRQSVPTADDELSEIDRLRLQWRGH